MKTWEPSDSDGKFELTSMIDIVFLLIAFFMTLNSFASSELIPIKTPISIESKAPESNQGRQFISIIRDQSGVQYYLGAVPVPDNNLKAIEEAVHKKALQNPKEFKVYLRADSYVQFEDISKVMEACGKAGVADIVFGTVKQ